MYKKETIIIFSMLLFMFSLLGVIFFGENGLTDLNNLKKRRDIIVEQNKIINQENMVFYRSIQRLKNDPEFIEDVAKEELGMIGIDEIVFKFSKTYPK
ncbi:MAG: septum formation initiator family protein [Desulfobacterales bacterium]|nr:septum formation initiator family protein [Desulfobacterales bacterium]